MTERTSIHEFSLYTIDIHTNSEAIKRAAEVSTDVADYAEKLVEDINNSERNQVFCFDSETVEVASSLAKLSGLQDGAWDEFAEAMAKRLFIKEKQAQEKYGSITKLRNGSLILVLAEHDGSYFVIIAKVDHAGFLEESTLLHNIGLPDSNRVQKVALLKATKECVVDTGMINVSDSNSKISDYWVTEFLESQPASTPRVNTLKSFTEIDRLLDRQVKNISGSDYWTIRNATLAFYRINASFTLDGYISSVIENYDPDEKSVDIPRLVKLLKQLPQNKGFDSQFNIEQGAIKAKVKKIVRLVDNLELNIKGEIDNMYKVIETGEDNGGGKFLKIYSESGYNEFSGKK